jgi:Flp pilus assembly protein TadG
MPLFLLLLFGVMEAGRFIQVQETLTDAAREGARHAVEPQTQTSILPSTGQIQARVNTFLSAAGITGAVVTPTPVSVVTGGITTQYTRVTVTLTYPLLSGIPWFNMLRINMRGQALMRKETSP